MRWTRLDEHTALELSAGILLVALTVLSVILGELVPKAIALQYPTQTALFTVLPMQWSLRAYAWLIALLNGSAVAILRALRAAEHRRIDTCTRPKRLRSSSRKAATADCSSRRSRSDCIGRCASDSETRGSSWSRANGWPR